MVSIAAVKKTAAKLAFELDNALFITIGSAAEVDEEPPGPLDVPVGPIDITELRGTVAAPPLL